MITKQQLEEAIDWGSWNPCIIHDTEFKELCTLALEALNNRQWTPDKSRPVDIGEAITVNNSTQTHIVKELE